MFWFFATLVVMLTVYERGFRRFLLACAGFSLIVATIMFISESFPKPAAEAIAQTTSFDPDAYLTQK